MHLTRAEKQQQWIDRELSDVSVQEVNLINMLPFQKFNEGWVFVTVLCKIGKIQFDS